MSRKKAKVESKVTQESKVEEAAAGQGSNDFDRQAQTEEDVAAASADQGSSRDTCEEQADGLATELEQLRGELAAANDRYLRKLAEFDNFRRRTRQEQTLTRSRARDETLTQLLPVLDDLQRLLEQDPTKLTADTLLSGVRLATEKFQRLLEGMQVVPFVSQGQAFDPDLHDALTTMCDPEQDDGLVLAEHLKGYKSGEQVIRHAQVVVNRREEA